MISTSAINLWVNNVPFRTPAWNAVGFGGLTVPDVRGSNRVLPGSAGVIAHPKRATESTRSIHMHFYGGTSPWGDPFDDPHAGLEANLDTFAQHVTNPPVAWVTAVLHKADGSVWSGRVQPISPPEIRYESPSKARVVVTLILPDGALTLVES